MSDASKKLEIWLFLCLIVIVNSVFVAAISSGLLWPRLYPTGRFLLLGATLALVVFAFRRFAGLADLVRSLSAWKVNPLWYLLALVWAPSVATLFLLGKGLLTGTDAFDGLTLEYISHPRMLVTIVIAALIGEIVWVAYSISNPSKRFGMLGGPWIVAAFWTLWWTPIALFGKGVVPEMPIPYLFVNLLGIATMCGFMYLTSRSGTVVFVLQFIYNLSFLAFPVVPTNGGPLTFLAFSATYFFAALALFLMFGPRPLFGRAPRLAEEQIEAQAVA